jgi:vitamin B12 transporter
MRLFPSLAVIAILPASAQTVLSERIEIFAERGATVQVDGSRSVTVLGREEIERRTAASVTDLLQEIAGVHVDSIGGRGTSHVYVRGSEPNHVLVLVDGVRMNDPTDDRGGSFDFGSLGVDEIERIEVLRGASSTQFGADAIGGVINIVTRRSRKAGGRAEAGQQGFAFASARFGAAPVSISVERRVDGRGRSDGNVSLSAFDVSLEGTPWTGAQTGFTARRGERDQHGFPESSGGARLAVLRDLESESARDTSASLRHRQLFGGTTLSLQATLTDRDETRASPAVAEGPGGFVPAVQSDTRYRRENLLAQLSMSGLVPSGTLMMGAEASRETGTSRSVLFLDEALAGGFDLQRDTRAAFLQYEGDWHGALVSLSVRTDQVDPGGRNTTRGAGLRYVVSERLSLRGHWNEGFKPPSFFALANPIVGNAALVPERSRSLEAGIDWRGERASLNATAFRNDTMDLVDFDAASFRLVNRNASRTSGVELSAQAQWQLLRFEASYTYLRARLEDSSEKLRNRPRNRGSVGVALEEGAWTGRVAAVHVGSSTDFSIPTGDVTLPAYTLINTNVRWRRGGVTLHAAIDNLTARRNESYVGFPGTPRRFRAGFALEL